MVQCALLRYKIRLHADRVCVFFSEKVGGGVIGLCALQLRTFQIKAKAVAPSRLDHPKTPDRQPEVRDCHVLHVQLDLH